MDMISVLKAKVAIDGVAKANAELAGLDATLHKVAGTAGMAGGDLDKVSTAAKDVDRDLSKARATVSAADADISRARKSVSGLGDDFNGQRKAVDGARVGIDAIGGSLQGFGADLRQAHDAINDSRGGLQSLRSDLDRARDTAGTAGAGIKHAAGDGADALRGLGEESRHTTNDVQGLSTGFERAQRIIASATAQLEKTGSVSGGVQADLRSLSSRGVSGLDRDMDHLRSTLSKAESELDRAGSLSRRTMRDIEQLGNGAGGAGGGLSTLSAALAGLPGGFSALGAAAVFLVPVLIALGGATVAVVSALGPLVGLAGAAGVGLVAAAQGFGVFKLAASGVAAALREQTTGQDTVAKSAISSASQQRAAAQAVQSAMDGVYTAHEQVITATQQLADAERQGKAAQVQLTQARIDAKRALVDMHLSLNQAIDSEQAAILALKDAKDALAQTLAGTSPDDIAKAQQAVTQAMHDQQQAAIDLTAAQDAYNAVVANSTSTDAQKAQALLNLQKAQDGVTNAAFATTDAQRALARLQAGPSDEEKAKALLAVKEAQDQLTRATVDRKRQQDDTNTSDALGVKGSAQVLAALEAVRKAQQATASAQRGLGDAERGVARATQAVNNAQLNSASSAASAALGSQRLNRAMSALPAPAQAFVRQLVALKPRLDELRATAAAGLFPGARAGLLEAVKNFEPVKRVVSETAGALGGLAQRAGGLVGSKAWGSDIATVGRRNASIIGTLGDAALHVADAIRHVVAAAGPLTSWLAKSTDEWAKNVDQAAKAGRENGKLAGFFDRTRDVLRLLGSIIANVAGGLLGIGNVGARSGNEILHSTDAAARRFDQWANSVGGRRSIQRFFEESRRLASGLVPVLGSLSSTVGTLALRTLPLVTALQLLGPLAGPLVTAFVAYKIAVTGIAVATKVWTAAQWLLNVALDANPIGAVVLAIAALVGGLVLAYTKVRWFHDAVDATFGWIKDHWPLLIAILTGPIGTAAYLVIHHWDAVKDFFAGLPQRLVDLLKAAPKLLGDAGSWILDQVVAGFEAVTDLLGGIGRWIWSQVENLVKAELAGWKTIGTWVLNHIVEGFKEVTDLLGTVGSWLKKQFETFIHNEIDGLKIIGRWVLNHIVDGFKGGSDLLNTVGSWLKNQVVSLVHATVDDLGSLGGWILDRIVDGITAVTKIGGKLVSGLSGVGSWILRQLKGLLVDIKDDFSGLGRDVIGWIVDGLTGGLKLVGKFINKVIGVLNTGLGFAGVRIDPIDVRALATGGRMSSAGIEHYATGGEVRRGTKITKPMIMMAEEAPQHPEFVIPTNPAYRGRAHMLLDQAAKATGFMSGGVMGLATGGVMSQFEIANLAGSTGFPNPALSSAIAMAESGGRTNATNYNTNGTVDRGLWQINSVHSQFDPSKLFEPAYNARAAFSVSGGGTNWTPWVTYNTGAYKQFLGGGGTDGGGIGGAIGGALGGIGGALGSILSGGAKFILDKLPNPADSLPDWLVGTGKYVIDHVSGWVKDQVGNLLGGPGPLDKAASAVQRITRMASFANALDAMDIPYGPQGHSGWAINPAGEDCSSTVSKVLHAGGFLSSVLDTTLLPGALEHGLGRYVTVHDRALPGNAGHTVIQIGDKIFGTSGQNPGGGPGWINLSDSYLSTLPTKLHPTGLAQGGILGGLPFGGFFENGGIVGGPAGAPVAIVAHGGERVTPVGGDGGSIENAAGLIAAAVRDALSDARIYLGDREVTDIVRVEIGKRDRQTGSSYFAGRAG